MDLLYIVAGAVVGFVIGLTGVGGGSLMTPILVLGFGISPAIAVGTDLLYAAITKCGGVFFHQRNGTIDWTIVRLLASGSIPSSILTIFLLDWLNESNIDYDRLITLTLGSMLILTSFVIIIKTRLLNFLNRQLEDNGSLHTQLRNLRPLITICSGLSLGVLVTISSVGAGAIGAAILLLLYPHKRAATIIGTDIAHAVPLTAIAGIGHAHIGTVDFALLGGLLLGGLPAIYAGSLLGKSMPDSILRPIVALILLTLGINFTLAP